MRGILDFVLHGRRGHRGTHHTPLQAMPMRPMKTLRRVKAAHTSAFAAAFDGELSAEEYLALENDDE